MDSLGGPKLRCLSFNGRPSGIPRGGPVPESVACFGRLFASQCENYYLPKNIIANMDYTCGHWAQAPHRQQVFLKRLFYSPSANPDGDVVEKMAESFDLLVPTQTNMR